MFASALARPPLAAASPASANEFILYDRRLEVDSVGPSPPLLRMREIDMQSPSNQDPGRPPGDAILGRFRIEKTLGHGGMGEVLLAVDTLLNRRVALKRLLPAGADAADGREAVLREARRASRINDPHVAALYDVLEHDGQVILVMEYVDGITLRERLRDPLPLAEFWNLASQCVRGVAAAHGRGVIHRDLKPDNLMVARDGVVKILDFGVARRSTTDLSTTTTVPDGLADRIAGTPRYMAPESHLGKTVDERTDLFALGAVFHEMLTGTPAFHGATYAAILSQVLHETPPSVSELNPEVGPALSAIVTQLLAKQPEERIGSAQELLDRMEQVRSGDPGRTVTLVSPKRRAGTHRASPKLVTAILAGCAVLAVAATLALRGPPALPREPNLAILPPSSRGGPDFAAFALGATEILSAGIRKHAGAQNLQVAWFSQILERHVQTPADARRVLGANLALASTLEQGPEFYSAKLDLVETASGKRLASRSIRAPLTQPFQFLDRLDRGMDSMMRLRTRADSAAVGARGTGTLRFHLQGLGRTRTATTEDEALRAVSDLETACRVEPEAAVVRAALASAQLKVFVLGDDRGWLERAEASAREAVRAGPTRPEAHRVLAGILAAGQRYAEALEEYQRALALDPTDDEIAIRVARTYNKLRQPEDERNSYRALIARRPHIWQPYWYLAAWEYRQGNVDSSIAAYREMIRRAPDFAEGYSSLGGLLTLRGRYAQAIDTLRRALALSPTRDAFDNLGTAYFNSGRFREAIDAYNQAFQFGEADYRTWLNLGDAYLWLDGRLDHARDAYAQAIRLGREEIASTARRGRPVDATIPANLATMFARIGEPDSARVYLKRAVAADGTNPVVEYCAALTHWDLGEREEGMSWLRKSVAGGYPTQWLKDSPMFHGWRSTAGFLALVDSAGPAS